jgi:hypothetical protein
MSTGRGWSSCMAADGMHSRYLPRDIRHGTLVAYLVSEKDPDILEPLARVLIKPYHFDRLNNWRCEWPISLSEHFKDMAVKLTDLLYDHEKWDSHIYVVADKQYGYDSQAFDNAVREFVADHLNDGRDGGYHMNDRLYADGAETNVQKKGRRIENGYRDMD